MADALNLLFSDQLGDALKQGLFVDLVGQLVHDDGLALAFVYVFKVAARAHDDFAATGTVTFFDAANAVNNACGWEVWRRDDLHEVFNAGLWVVQHVHAGINHFVQVVWGNVGRHTHRNTSRAVDQQVGQARWHYQRLLL